jgi:hypothetical protein
MLSHLSSANRLACLLCRPALSENVLEAARSIAGSGVDWDAFFAFVEKEGVFPLIARHAAAMADIVPVPTRASLLAHTAKLRERSEAMAAELTALLAAFESRGIPAVPVKGPVLAQRIWGDYRLSHSLDLDVLVRREDAPRATEVLLGRGYKTPEHALSRLGWRLGNWSVVFGRTEGVLFPLVVDLTVALETVWIRQSRLRRVWDELERDRFGGREIRVLPDRWSLLLAALHALRHLFHALRWPAVVRGLIALRPEVWEGAVALAGELGLREELILARDVSDAILSEAPVDGGALDPIVRRLAESMFVPESKWRDAWLQIPIRRRLRSKIAYVLAGALHRKPLALYAKIAMKAARRS